MLAMIVRKLRLAAMVAANAAPLLVPRRLARRIVADPQRRDWGHAVVGMVYPGGVGVTVAYREDLARSHGDETRSPIRHYLLRCSVGRVMPAWVHETLERVWLEEIRESMAADARRQAAYEEELVEDELAEADELEAAFDDWFERR